MSTPEHAGLIPSTREARPGDDSAIADLVGRADEAMIAFRGGDVLRREVPAPTFAAGDDDRLWFVADVGGVVVGVLTAHINTDTGTIVIDRVFVDPSARAHGAGDALIVAVLSAAEHRGIRRADGWALPGDRETKNLYERNGLTARAIIASRTLGE